MIIAIYKDDGPLHGGGQDMERTAPQEKAVPFPDYEEFCSADKIISEESARRRNPRYIKWYEVEGVIPTVAVRDALAELRSDVLRLPAADYSDGDGAELIDQDSVLELIDGTMTALGLGADHPSTSAHSTDT